MSQSGKKIIVVGPSHPFRGGIASFTDRLVQQFQDEGHRIEIYTFTTQYPNFLFPGKTQYSEEPAPKDLKITRNVNSINPFNWIKIGKKIRKEKPDLLIFRFWLPFMGPCFGKIGRIAKKNGHTKIISILDNIIPHESRIGDKLLTRYFLKPVDGFISMSKTVEEGLATFDTTKPRDFNPHPLYDHLGPIIEKEKAKQSLGLSPSLNYILFFGIIRDYKGLDLLLEAFAQLDYKKRQIKLLVVGEFYSNEEKYQEQMKRLGIQDDVIVVNKFVKDAEVAQYFCAADMIAQPYKSATQSGVTQIAYHFEVPMLVTNVGGLPDMVPSGKVGYVTSQDTAEITTALKQFYEENKADEFIANLKEEKEKYSWDKLTAKLLKLLNLLNS